MVDLLPKCEEEIFISHYDQWEQHHYAKHYIILA